MMGNKLVLVTGGAGFIGSNLARYLLAKNYKVRVLDNLSTGKLENIKRFISDIEFVEGDVCDRERAKDIAEGAEFVFHLAALPSVPRSIEDPFTTNRVNVEGTLNLLLAAKKSGVKRFIYASSSSVYGKTGATEKHEDMPVHPASPYALSKYAGERYCQIFFEIYGLETVCLRYFNVFGPNQDASSQYAAVIPRFIEQIKSDEPITIFGDGNQSRDFTYVQNVVEANILAATVPGIAGEVFNIACGRRTTVKELANMLMKEIGANVEIMFIEERKGDIKHSQASIRKAREYLNYRPKYSLEEGIKSMLSSLSHCPEDNGHS